MISNNNQRLNIWLTCSNKFDYNEFTSECVRNHITPLTMLDFAQKVGILEVSSSLYPHLPPDKAFQKLIDESNNIYYPNINNVNSTHSVQNIIPSKSCCGGGNIR